MQRYSKKIDMLLLDLAWSFWTELGVRAEGRENHHDFLIDLEALILLTTVLAEVDARLRDESLDWCAKYHRFVSTTRLKTVAKMLSPEAEDSFSLYSVTLNSISRASWPTLVDKQPLAVSLSHKSVLRPLKSPALMNIRARSIFGTGGRADVITFFLMHSSSNFSALDLSMIGYSKRNIAEILDELCLGGILNKMLVGNQQRYYAIKNERLSGILNPIPRYAPAWPLILEIIVKIRESVRRAEGKTDTLRAIEIRNVMALLEPKLNRLKLALPSMSENFSSYLTDFEEWFLVFLNRLAQGNFPDKFYLYQT